VNEFRLLLLIILTTHEIKVSVIFAVSVLYIIL